MRVRIILRAYTPEPIIPVNYNHHLSSLIYRCIKASSLEHATWLHEQGFVLGTKRFKHFTFSRLLIPERKIMGNRLQIFSPQVYWIVSMLVEESLAHFVVGLFLNREVSIGSSRNRFRITQVVPLEDPVFSSVMKFRTLSPITVSTAVEHDGRLGVYYYRPNDVGLSEALRKNMLSKYESIFGRSPEDPRFEFEMDADYVKRRGGYEKLTKLITIKEGEADETRVKGFDAVFTLRGNPELIRLAYESGLGERGSLGFGCIEAVR